MFKNSKLSDDEAFHLNFGLPLILSIVVFIVNGMFFEVFFVENVLEFIKIYLFFLILIVAIDFFRQKLKKSKKIRVKLNLYKNVLLSFLLVFIFLVLNTLNTKPVFKVNIKSGKGYESRLEEYKIPENFAYLFEIKEDEYTKYYNSKHYLSIEVNKSLFGYKILNKRAFIKY